jgi:hypothetical protein
MSSRRRNSVGKLIDEGVAEMLESVGKTGGTDAESLAELQRLVALEQIYKSSSAYKRTWQRLPLLIAACVTLAIASFLIFDRIPTSQISLDAKVSEFSFVVKNKSILNRPWSVSGLSVDDAEQLSLPQQREPRETVRFTDDQAYATISLSNSADSAAKIVVNTLVLDSGVRVSIAQRGRDKFELKLTPVLERPTVLKFTLKGTVTLSYPEGAPTNVAFDLPREAIAITKERPLVVSLNSTNPLELAQNIPITDLTFTENQEYYDPQQTILRSVSSVMQATLYQESLNGTELKIREGEDIRFKNLDGTLRSVRIGGAVEKSNGNPPPLAVEFTGTIGDVTIGQGDLQRSGMPSVLEWLAKRQAAVLFWGACLYAIGLVATIWNWYRNNS